MSRRVSCFALVLGLVMQSGLAAAEARPACVEAEARRVRPYADHLHVRARPRVAGDVRAIWSLAEVVLAPHDPALTEHDLFVTEGALAALRAAGVDAEVLPESPQEIVDRSYG